MPPCFSLRDWYESGKSTHLFECSVYLISQPRFLHFTLNHYNSRRSSWRKVSRSSLARAISEPASATSFEPRTYRWGRSRTISASKEEFAQQVL